MKISTVKNAVIFFINDNYRFRCILLDKLRHSGILNWLSDKAFIKLSYWVFFKKSINLKNPQSFNEKLNWLKLHNKNANQSVIVDKYEVKKYICDRIGEQYIIKTYGVWNSFEEIDFDKLPQKFVLKCTHDSGSVVICKDKSNFDIENAKQKLTNGLKQNLFWWGREWPYKSVQPRILAEECLEDFSDNDLKDYKFFCFDGVVKCFKVDFGRFTEHRANYYSYKGDLLDIGEVECPPNHEYNIKLPENLAEMVSLAENLSKGFPFLRVDFYNVNGHIYFGELTFYPASALSPFIDYKSDLELGQYLRLPKCK